MRVVVIGDSHCSVKVGEIITKEQDIASRIILVGDYLDPYDDPRVGEADFLEWVISKKEELGDQLELLIGNHDFHYLPAAREVGVAYSRFSRDVANKVVRRFRWMLEQGWLKLATLEGEFLISHAGFSQSWVKHWKLWEEGEVDLKQLERLFIEQPMAFDFYHSDWSGYGESKHQGPLWIRPQSLYYNLWGSDKYRQIVGHTGVKELKLTGDIIFIDLLRTSGEYLVIQDGNLKKGEL